jgi:hypothetical protein
MPAHRVEAGRSDAVDRATEAARASPTTGAAIAADGTNSYTFSLDNGVTSPSAANG